MNYKYLGMISNSHPNNVRGTNHLVQFEFLLFWITNISNVIGYQFRLGWGGAILNAFS